MATGESIFFGAARVFKPLMWFFYVAAILIYIWPGHLSAGAAAFDDGAAHYEPVTARSGGSVAATMLRSRLDQPFSPSKFKKGHQSAPAQLFLKHPLAEPGAAFDLCWRLTLLSQL